MDELIRRAQARLAELLTQRQARTDELTAMRAQLADDAQAGDVTEERIASVVAARDAIDDQINEARQRVEDLTAEQARDQVAADLARQYVPATEHRSQVTVGAEPEVYRKGGQRSYFRDLYRATLRNDSDSRDHLLRNDRHVEAGLEARAIGSTDGGIGEFVPPLWMIEEYEKLARAGRVFANLCNGMALPAGTDSVSIPKVTGGTSVATQGSQGTALSETDMTSGSTTAAVDTQGGGVQTASLQLVEQSPINIDEIIFADLAVALAVAIDTFALTANTTNKHGVLNATGVNAITYTDASPTVPELWPKLVDAARQVHSGRFMPATAAVMTPTRWAWFQAALDSNNRPYVSDSAASAIPLLGQTDGAIPEGLAGTIRGLSLPVYLDANIPINLGGGANEDRIIVGRPQDVTLLESTPQAAVFTETKAKEMQVVFRLYQYVAILSERAPKGISVIAGTGLAQPSF